MSDRREFLKLAALGGGAVFMSALPYEISAKMDGKIDPLAKGNAYGDFYFVQLSDTHVGYTGAANPESATTLKKAIAAVNALETPPEFIMFTGDLTHTTDDPKERRQRLAAFKEIASELNVKNVRYMPGEHDASLDAGAAYKEFFGETRYTFDHKGVHFVVVDNVSDPGASIGEAQLKWLKDDLAKQKKDARIVVFTHRPLFDLAPKWDWATRDGAQAVDILLTHKNVTVFYGHIHQEHHHMTGHIAHHSAKSLIFALPVPGSQEKRTPLLWDSNAPFKGLGFREIEAEVNEATYKIQELPVTKA